MEREIDLRVYVLAVVRRWWLIGGMAVVAGVIALVVSVFRPPSYEAEAMVAFTVPQYVANFDPRFETVTKVTFPYKAFPDLAMSDQVLGALREKVVEKWPNRGAGLGTVEGLRRVVRARSAVDPSLVVLEVRTLDAEEAAYIANAWAEAFVSLARDIYGRSSDELSYYEEQLGEVDAELTEAEEALEEFQRRNEGEILKGELVALQVAQASYLEEQKEVEDTIRDLEGLLSQFEGYGRDAPVALADELTVLLMEINAFNGEETTQLQLQLGGEDSLLNRSAGEVRAFLESLSTTLGDRLTAIESTLSELEPRMLDLQGRIEEDGNEFDRLMRAKEVASETYLILTRKVEETRLAAESPSSEVRLVSQASVPIEPAGPQKLANALLAGTLGLLLGVFVVLIAEWWRVEKVA